jgi:hypothetical protein
MTDTDPITAAVLAEIERVHPRFHADGMPPGWVAVTVPEPCEVCGTRVFAAQVDDLCSPPQVFHIGWIHTDDTLARMVQHTAKLCREVRDGGPALEGRRITRRKQVPARG